MLLSDEAPASFHFDSAHEQFDQIVTIKDLGIEDLRRWMFGHDIVELCTAVKGAMLARLLQAGYDYVVYLDPDTAVFSPLNEMLELVERSSVVLTPHIVSPEATENGVIDNEIGSLKHGVYNLGFVAVRNVAAGVAFGNWWRGRLLKFCHDDVPNGLFTDQRWCDLVPALFDGVAVLRHCGYNVASWNLSGRPIAFTSDGEVTAGNFPLRFFHFTKINTVGEAMLERYAFGKTEVFELLRWYRERLIAHRAEGLPEGWWAYGTYMDGKPIRRAERLMWRVRGDLRETFKDPYASGRGTYSDWCAHNFATG
ncbi:hypothetical protein [Achromobacter xylosoxidans]|uniref:hypothetical protein n=1 Tax=Alcaligenes xylosoxydans xylosoxydans TaxID=85698 RepID=UPI000A72B139|nr:hypothetical protein [Achromobacter xylosoxidans]